MNIEVRAQERSPQTKLDIVDCDFHPKMAVEQMRPFLSNQWWSYLQTYGSRARHGYTKGYAYPKMTPQAARRDAWPPTGGLPASDLAFVQAQHMDFYGIDAAIMNPLSPTGQGDQNVELSIAMAAAANTNSFTTPSGVGTTMIISSTPATFAGMAFINTDEGYAALPPGT